MLIDHCYPFFSSLLTIIGIYHHHNVQISLLLAPSSRNSPRGPCWSSKDTKLESPATGNGRMAKYGTIGYPTDMLPWYVWRFMFHDIAGTPQTIEKGLAIKRATVVTWQQWRPGGLATLMPNMDLSLSPRKSSFESLCVRVARKQRNHIVICLYIVPPVGYPDFELMNRREHVSVYANHRRTTRSIWEVARGRWQTLNRSPTVSTPSKVHQGWSLGFILRKATTLGKRHFLRSIPHG